LLVTAGVVPSSPILVTLMKEALSSSETSVVTRATLRIIPEDAILRSEWLLIYLFKSWANQNFITIKTNWITKEDFFEKLNRN
jgi:hypothetical protein